MYTVTILGAGLALGMYITYQISEHIDRNIRRKKFFKNIEEFDKKYKNK